MTHEELEYYSRDSTTFSVKVQFYSLCIERKCAFYWNLGSTGFIWISLEIMISLELYYVCLF